MIFSVTLVCFYYRNVLLLTRVKTIQWAMALFDFAFNGFKDSLFIQPSALKLYVNAKMCDPCPSCRIVM